MAATSPAPMRAVGVAATAFTLAPSAWRLGRVSTVPTGRLRRCRTAHRRHPPRCRGKPAVGGVVEDDEEDEASREDLKPERKKEETEDTVRAVLGWFRLDEVGMDILGIALPAVLALAADPITALVDTAFVGHIGSVELAAVGVSISVFNLVSKLFNVPLLNVTTSFVAEQQATDADYSGVGESKQVGSSICLWKAAIYFCGATVGLVYSNNLGQMAQSLHRQSELTMLLAVYSSFFGRLLSALPEFLPRKVSFARTGWLAAALVPMPMAFFLTWESQGENTLVAGTALIGLSSGFIFAAAVSVASELFGPNSIGMNHNILITNIPLGSLLYGQIAALVYDANGLRKTVQDNGTGRVETMIVCMGASCYSTTFLVWGCITLLGLASSIVLFFRTRQAYAAGQSSFKHRSQVSS